MRGFRFQILFRMWDSRLGFSFRVQKLAEFEFSSIDSVGLGMPISGAQEG